MVTPSTVGGLCLQHIPHKRPSLKPKPVDFQVNWDFLVDGMRKVLTDPFMPPSVAITQYYHIVYKLCTGQCSNLGTNSSGSVKEAGQQLYSHLKAFLIDYIENTVVRSVTGSHTEILRSYLKQWDNFKRGMDYINALFHYMNEDWVKKQSQGTADVRTLGYVCWKLYLYKRIKSAIIGAVLDQIECDRRYMDVDGNLLSGVIKSIVSLGVDQRSPSFYSEQFENEFLQATERFYEREVAQKLDSSSCPDQSQLLPKYMKHIELRLEEEHRRLKSYLHHSTEKNLMKTMIKVTINDCISTLLEMSQEWFDKDQVEEQMRLFRLLEQSDGGLEPLRKLVEDRIDAEGKATIQRVRSEALRDPCVYVEAILQVYKKYAGMVRDIFENHQHFRAALDKGCRRFINKNAIATTSGAKSADLVAKYAHMLLKPSSKAAKQRSEQELDEALGEVLTIFNLLEDVDVFQKVYRDKLSNRLIQNSYVQEQETLMITKLKVVCAYEYTYKLQQMFTDMEISKEINATYSEWSQATPLDDATVPHLTTNILKSVSWPQTWQPPRFIVPPLIQKALDHFTTFYKERHQARSLSWQPSQSHGLLRANYLRIGRRHDFQVTTQQAAVLLAFNNWAVATRTLAELDVETKLGEKELDFCLQVLYRCGVLLSSTGSDFKRTSFVLNEDFHSNSRKVQLNNVQYKEGQAAEDTATPKVIAEDRKYAIQAAIVRIMKDRKTIAHAILVQDVTAQLRGTFTPSNQDIKKNIENLIEKDYVERTSDGKSYTYLA
ncbi:Cullin-1 [Diplonema papillatum]|nr:Cullin-1 [Diplonema papillatum]